MSQTFNFRRFKRLFAKYTRENSSKLLLSALVACGIVVLFYLFTLMTGRAIPVGFRFGTFSIFLLLVGSIFTSTVFAEFNSKTKSVAALTLPASHLEKFLVGWLYSYPIYSLVFVICFGLIDYIFVQNSVASEKVDLYHAMPPGALTVIFAMFTTLHGVVLFGSAYFRNQHFVKTAVYLFIFLAILCLFNYSGIRMLIPGVDIVFTPPFLGNYVNFQEGEHSYHTVRLDPAVSKVIIGTMVTSVTAALWAASFLQIKERQI